MNYLNYKKSTFILILVSFIFFLRCENEIDNNVVPISRNGVNNSNINLEGELEISDFIWRGLNEFYWQDGLKNSLTKNLRMKNYAKYIVKIHNQKFLNL